jgi:hypothetical protein
MTTIVPTAAGRAITRSRTGRVALASSVAGTSSH